MIDDAGVKTARKGVCLGVPCYIKAREAMWVGSDQVCTSCPKYINGE